MFVPVLLVGAEAIRSNALERRALEALGESMARSRTYAELETAMFDQGEVIWRYLSGMDPVARQEFAVSNEVVRYWQERWEAELSPSEKRLATDVRALHDRINTVAESVFSLYERGQRKAAFALARSELKGRLFPALTLVNREIYRQLRQSSVRGAYARLEEILAQERRILLLVTLLALGIGILASWFISRGLARPIQELSDAMARMGAGELDRPIQADRPDEIGQLARAFSAMRANLGQAQAQLVQSEKLASIGQMAAAVAHGLRNPLASLRATAQLALRQQPGSPAAHESLTAIVDEVDRLDRRISHLLAFARPAPFRPLREGLPLLLDGALAGLAGLLRERRVELVQEIPPDLPEVRVDPMQFEQVVVEVVSNAVDAMPDGGRLTITARLAKEGPEGPAVVIDIADTGAGIPEQVLPSVCDPFFTTRPEGTGLGLAMAKRYVEQNGGRLAIESTAGTGTVVRISLPVADASKAARDEPLAAGHGARGAEARS